ncbi:TerD family protein [Prosthecobacter vanneervenii]|uniref:Cytoplasmic protein n=1 Tax=Prosthecobacter vanneervenii TaxID=48466 RepID=A0A7W7YAR2_9BACT|nr:TerD family protein [Prosthecobacter vanneervenii]MBB5032635.1 hypothetical protein [Prosthecobacter vanneervenii]
MNTLYLRRRKKVLLPPGTGSQSGTMLAMMQQNLEALGFVMSPTLMERVQTLSDRELAAFYTSLIQDIRQMVGAHRPFAPMYPDFPRQVKETPELLLYLNALVHYLTNKLPVYPKSLRPELTDKTPLRVIDLGHEADFRAIFTQLAGAKTSLSPQDKEDLIWFVKERREQFPALLPQTIASKENLAVLSAAVLKHAPEAVELLAPHFKIVTDVLRLAVALSGGDVSLAASVKFGKFTRAERRLLLSWMERCDNALEDMLRWKGRWIRLGERLHPGEHAEKVPKIFAAFKALRADEKITTFNSRLEAALEKRQVDEVLGMLRSRPGDLARRMDHLLRLAARSESVLSLFQECVRKVSTPVLLQMLSHFQHRDQPLPLRVFFPKGDVGKVFAVSKKMPSLPTGVAAQAATVCECALVERFAMLPPLGRCWVEPGMEKFMVPLAQRSASKALRTLTRGSRLPLADATVLRFFIWWKNGRGRTDIDLSASLFDAEQRYLDVLSYYNLKNFGGCHSGDIVDAPEGAAEFIDVEPARLLAANVRYIVMTLSSYTQQPYCDLPECFAGWMARQAPDSGEVFEARTVVDKLDVAANTRICIPAVFDLVEREVIWADLALTAYPRLPNNVHVNLPPITLMLRSLIYGIKPDLHTLFSLHAKARGSVVAERAGADTIFAQDAGITPYDLDRIRADFL